jgi:hypothetical protein
MPQRPNYSQQRGDRDRAKRAKQQEKLKKREDDAARRKAARGDGPDETPGADAAAGDHEPEKA